MCRKDSVSSMFPCEQLPEELCYDFLGWFLCETGDCEDLTLCIIQKSPIIVYISFNRSRSLTQMWQLSSTYSILLVKVFSISPRPKRHISTTLISWCKFSKCEISKGALDPYLSYCNRAVYDISNKGSFESIPTWLSKARSRRPLNASPLAGVLVANKVRLKHLDCTLKICSFSSTMPE